MKQINNYIVFTGYGDGLGIAWQLVREGKNVIIAQVEDLKSIDIEESPEDKVLRWQTFTGMLEKQKAEKVLEQMAKIQNKDDYFVFFDFNSLWPYAEKVVKMGFKNGLFPSKFDYKLEEDREFGKSFIQSYYPNLHVAEVEEFKRVDEAVQFLEESDEFWALKANDISAVTVVPSTKILEFARSEIIDALMANKGGYERKGFILERQIRDGVEICPEMLYYNGKRVASSLDIENKAIGSGNEGIKCGCTQNIVTTIPMDCEINAYAFPEAMDKVAKKHNGLFFADVNLILKDGMFYYLENCGNRPGYDAFVTELDMSDGPSAFFDAVSQGASPFKRTYGTAVRGLNLHTDSDTHNVKGGINMKWKEGIESHLWPFMIEKDKNAQYVNTPYWQDLITFTESSDDVDYAIQKVYEVIHQFSFNEMYYRSEGDFRDRSYSTALLNRLDSIKKFIQPQQSTAGNKK